MASREKRSFVQLVAVLLIIGGARSSLRDRAPEASLPGTPVDLALLEDSAARVAEDEARRAAPLGPGETLDPNRASESELDRLPGVGPSTAGAMVRARDSLPFATAEDLLRVRGIGPGTLARLAEYLELPSSPSPRVRSPSSPGADRTGAGGSPGPGATRRGRQTPSGVSGMARVRVNTADTDGLQRLPGVGPALAARIVAHRAGGGRFRSPEDLLAIRGVGQATLDRMRPFLDFSVR